MRIWGVVPGAQPLEFGKISLEDTNDSPSEASQNISEEVPGGSNATEDSEAMNGDEGILPGSKKRKSATARYEDDKGKKLEKQLSGKQKDGLMLRVMREDVELKMKLLVQSEPPSKADGTLIKIADSMHALSQAILTGFQHLQVHSLQHQPVARGTQEQTVVQDQFLGGRYGYQTNKVPGTSGKRPFTPPSFSGRASPYSVSMSSNNSVMSPLHEAVTWYKICHSGWQATHLDIQNKEKSRLHGGNRFVLEAVAFFCHPAWQILYHVTVSCKEPIDSSDNPDHTYFSL